MTDLERALDHAFSDRSLLTRALTHASYAHEHEADDNERLEFLGDSVLALCTTLLLFERFPDAPEGELTSLRHKLVDSETLAGIGREIGLGDALRLGKSERQARKQRGSDKPKILEDAVEALVGALWLDAGLDTCCRVVRGWMTSRVDALVAEAGALGWEGYKRPKSRLQERTQRLWKQLPKYKVIGCEGPDHARIFTVQVQVGQRVLASGAAGSKKLAERQAARAALAVLDREGL